MSLVSFTVANPSRPDARSPVANSEYTEVLRRRLRWPTELPIDLPPSGFFNGGRSEGSSPSVSGANRSDGRRVMSISEARLLDPDLLASADLRLGVRAEADEGAAATAAGASSLGPLASARASPATATSPPSAASTLPPPQHGKMPAPFLEAALPILHNSQSCLRRRRNRNRNRNSIGFINSPARSHFAALLLRKGILFCSRVKRYG
mmetsp:Transcript_43235/g.102584  ORF Transcript_43235/g.102584 Transcript_43235/m.102584 type:complete len:207 (+) Transcript_43235:386-1006(+)